MGVTSKLAQFSPMAMYKYLEGLKDNFGWPFFLLMTSTYVGVKGSLHFFGDFSEFPYYKEIGLEGAQFQMNSAASFTPWTAKGFIGVLSDTLPIFGYQKTAYLFIFNIFGAVGCCSLAALPLEIAADHSYIPALLFFLIYTQTAGYDLLLEGKYVEQMKFRPKTKGNLVTYSWFGTLAGQIFPAIFVGLVADQIDIRWIYIICVPFSVQPLIFISIGGMINDTVPSNKNFKLDRAKIQKDWKPMFLAVLTGIGGIGLAFTALALPQFYQLVYAAVASAIMIGFSFAFLNRTIAQVNTYKFFGQTLYINITGALDFWYTADEDCVPGGPHFDYIFYRTWVQVLGIIAQILGLAIFQVVFMNWRFRFIYWFSTCLRILGSVFDIVLVNRWNKAIGIPDTATYILGNAIVYKVTYMIDYIPSIIINARLCPKDIESTMFALLASSSNYGQSISKLIGAYLMTALNIRTTNEQVCNFDNLTLLIIISHMIAPLGAVILAFFLIPNANANDNLVDSKEVIQEYNEIAKKWEEKNVQKLEV